MAAHLFGIVGFVLLSLGLLALSNALSPTRAEPIAFAAMLTGWIGTGLAVPAQGAETFGLHAAALEAPTTGRSTCSTWWKRYARAQRRL